MDGKFLGKISRAWFGPDPDHDNSLCLSTKLWFDGRGTDWMQHDLNAVRDLMVDAQAYTVNDLIGKPIEVTVKGGGVTSWRILTEVL